MESNALQFVVPSPVKSPGVQPRNRHDGHSLFTPSISALTKCAGYVGKPEQPESGGACFRETNELIDPPCGELACALRILEARGHGLKAKARLARSTTTSAAPDR